MSRNYVIKAKEMAWSGAYPEDEPYLNPFKNHLSNVFNSEYRAQVWMETFINECHEAMLKDAENADGEADHS